MPPKSSDLLGSATTGLVPCSSSMPERPPSVLRLGAATVEEARKYDVALRQAWSELLGRPIHELAWKRMCLPQRMGGCGV
eukprot:2360929-Alexandrium_andersonii.AAC.1